jgi:hypothetical protein
MFRSFAPCTNADQNALEDRTWQASLGYLEDGVEDLLEQPLPVLIRRS